MARTSPGKDGHGQVRAAIRNAPCGIHLADPGPDHPSADGSSPDGEYADHADLQIPLGDAAVPGLLQARIPQAACRTRCACEPGAPTRSDAELRLSSRPRARYQSRPGVPPSVARRFAATSPIASTITPARVRLSTAARAAAASITSVITCCRRLASRASCRGPDMGAGPADLMLIVISSRSPRNHLRSDPALAVSFRPLSQPQGELGGPAQPSCPDLPCRARWMIPGGPVTVSGRRRSATA